MNTTIRKHTPTKEEVLDAVDRATVFTNVKGLWGEEAGTRKHQPQTAAGIMERIYTDHHGQVVTKMYGSRMSELRKGVALGEVRRHLETLVDEGAILAVPGDHWSVRNASGVSGVGAKSTLYLGKEAAGLALEKEQQAAAARREKAAQEAAEKRVLARHADEVKAEWESILAETSAKAKPIGWVALDQDGHPLPGQHGQPESI